MGYATLDSALAFKNNLAPVNSYIAITDTLKSEANFLIHHFVVNQLKGNQRVVLVGLAQIFNHYFLIGRKLGINLQSLKTSGQFVFIDGLTHLNEYTKETPYPPSKAPTAPVDTLDYHQSEQVLKSFYLLLTKYIVQPGTVLILDDISCLLFNGFELNQVITFISQLKSFLSTKEGTLITVMHADEEGTEDISQDNFIKNILYLSNLTLQVQPLSSGLARDVHGQLDIIQGCQFPIQVLPQSMHFKILDNNVHFFAKGII